MKYLKRLRFNLSEERKKTKYLKRQIKEREKKISNLIEETKWIEEVYEKLYETYRETNNLIGLIMKFRDKRLSRFKDV